MRVCSTSCHISFFPLLLLIVLSLIFQCLSSNISTLTKCIIHELKRLDYRPYRSTNHTITSALPSMRATKMIPVYQFKYLQKANLLTVNLRFPRPSSKQSACNGPSQQLNNLHIFIITVILWGGA